jgi:maltose O-acetyltransferase
MGGQSEQQKMAAGEWYNCLDPALDALRDRARLAVHQHNGMSPDKRGTIGPALRNLFAQAPSSVFIEAPFHCSYGMNIVFGENVYLNAGCVILDSAPVHIGSGTMLGPSVQIYCAEHAKDPALRRQGLEIAKPVDIGPEVWIGGGAIILAGVTIGARAIIGAGSVVTRDVAADTIVVGNPAKAVR